jgi:hypothetical protein
MLIGHQPRQPVDRRGGGKRPDAERVEEVGEESDQRVDAAQQRALIRPRAFLRDP